MFPNDLLTLLYNEYLNSVEKVRKRCTTLHKEGWEVLRRVHFPPETRICSKPLQALTTATTFPFYCLSHLFQVNYHYD